jgi:cellulose synthase/poly-beta-1,6-N-acetylglucosamine synthase-like glycosyltransferase
VADVLAALIGGFNHFVFWYFVLWNAAYLGLVLLSFVHIRNYLREVAAVDLHQIFRSTFYQPISLLVPAFNEERTLSVAVRSMLQLEYPEYELIVINDGSTDDTLRLLIEEHDLVPVPHDVVRRVPCGPIRRVLVSRRTPRLVVVDKVNGGKADALNAGINVSKHPLVCSVDADSLLERDCLLKVVRPFMTDARTVAAGGIIRILNGCTVSHGQNVRIGVPVSHLARFQLVEYLRAFLFGRVGLDVLNCLLITSGAFTLLRKDVVVEVGGYRRNSSGEDMELICRLHRRLRRDGRPYRITFVPDPVCWTEVPESFSILARQRNRWHRGLLEALSSNLGMLFNPRYGSVGLVGMPLFCCFEMVGPVIEVVGYVVFAVACVLGLVEWPFALLFLFAATALGIVLSITSIFLEELSFQRYPRTPQLLVLFVYGVLENFGFRQLLVVYRVQGLLDFFRGKTHWGDMGRSREGRRPRRGRDAAEATVAFRNQVPLQIF